MKSILTRKNLVKKLIFIIKDNKGNNNIKVKRYSQVSKINLKRIKRLIQFKPFINIGYDILYAAKINLKSGF